MKKFYIADSTFYITHSCNLTCYNCETYNNRRFKGHYKWNDYKDDYVEWSKKVDLGIINIHGGEPFTNPDIEHWAEGLKKLWPHGKDYTVSTNGTFVEKKQDLTKRLIDLGWRLDVSVHDPSTFDSILTSIARVFKTYNLKIKKQDNGEYVFYSVKNDQIIATVLPQYYFLKNSTKYIEKGVIHMHRSNIEKAHTLCQEYDNMPPCRWFVAGRLYKCHLTAISNDLINQFNIEKEAVDLLKKYKSASPYDSQKEIYNFIKNLKEPLKQCTLCPESSVTYPIYPLSNKK